MYILLTEMETTGFTSCKIQGLHSTDLIALETKLESLSITSIKQESFFEVDTNGVQLLNLLAENDYRISNQSMAIEKSNIGGRTIQVQKIVWTLYREKETVL